MGNWWAPGLGEEGWGGMMSLPHTETSNTRSRGVTIWNIQSKSNYQIVKDNAQEPAAMQLRTLAQIFLGIMNFMVYAQKQP